jgi:hypothetical protein
LALKAETEEERLAALAMAKENEVARRYTATFSGADWNPDWLDAKSNVPPPSTVYMDRGSAYKWTLGKWSDLDTNPIDPKA